MLDVNVFDTAAIIRKSALEAIGSFSTPESCQALVKAIETLSESGMCKCKRCQKAYCG